MITRVPSPESGRPQKLTREAARKALPDELRNVFDNLCDDTIAWSQFYYGTTFISYSILKALVEDGWTKDTRKNAL